MFVGAYPVWECFEEQVYQRQIILVSDLVTSFALVYYVDRLHLELDEIVITRDLVHFPLMAYKQLINAGKLRRQEYCAKFIVKL